MYEHILYTVCGSDLQRSSQVFLAAQRQGGRDTKKPTDCELFSHPVRSVSAADNQPLCPCPEPQLYTPVKLHLTLGLYVRSQNYVCQVICTSINTKKLTLVTMTTMTTTILRLFNSDNPGELVPETIRHINPHYHHYPPQYL